jgi:hypothetical protein
LELVVLPIVKEEVQDIQDFLQTVDKMVVGEQEFQEVTQA